MTPSNGSSPDVSRMTVGILGGTGPQGRGLAYRLGRCGQRVLLGSRSSERAAAAAKDLPASVIGLANDDCAREADVVIAAMPWDGHEPLLTSLRGALAGKIVIDCVNPLGFDDKGPFALPVPQGSACEQARDLLPESVITGAFHHLSAPVLLDEATDEIDSDVLVVSDDRDAANIVQALTERIPGARGVYAGRLRNAHQIEALTANLIAINRRYKAHSGIRVTDVA